MKRREQLAVVMGIMLFGLCSGHVRGQCPFESKLISGDAATGDVFGNSVSISGEIAIVGARLAHADGGCSCCAIGSVDCDDSECRSAICAQEPICCWPIWDESCAVVAREICSCCTDDFGAAYIYRKGQNGWHEVVKLMASDASLYAHFGNSVAISGHTAVVGAPASTAWGTVSNTASGAAYIFREIDGFWQEIDKLTPLDGAAGDRFGASVFADGDTVIIGASYDDDGGTNTGSAYIFREMGDVWEQVAKIVAVDPAAFDGFGTNVSLSESTAVVGAPFDDDKGTNSGSAYVFREIGGLWQQIAKLTAADGTAEDRFGSSVSISGVNVVVGAPFDEKTVDSWYADTGSAYFFREVGEAWEQVAKFMPVEPTAFNDQFGFSVFVDGDIAAIGRIGDDTVGPNAGSVYFFHEVDGFWSRVAKVSAFDGSAVQRLGDSISVSGGLALVGATFGDAGSVIDSGAAYVVDLSMVSQDCNRNGALDRCDIANGVSQDCNSNGIPDECDVVSAQVAKLTDPSPAPYDSFAYSVSMSVGTAIVGAHNVDDSGVDSGAAFVFVEESGIWKLDTQLNASDGAGGDNFGITVGIDGNTAVVGAHQHENGGIESGAAYIFRESSGNWQEIAQLTASDGALGDRFGRSVAISGDLALVGAPLDDDACAGNTSCNSGSAYVYREVAGTWQEVAKLTAPDGALGDQFGFAVALSESTALVGAWQGDNQGGVNAGSAYVFREINGVWQVVNKLTANDAGGGQFFGASIALSGNTAVIGAYRDNDAGSESGSAYVFREFAGTWLQVAKLTASDAATRDNFGYSVSLSGAAVVVGTTVEAVYVFRELDGTWLQTEKLNSPNTTVDVCYGCSISLAGEIALIGARLDNDSGSGSGAAYVYQLEPVSRDCNTNDILDECEFFPGDLSGDGDVDLDDVYLFQNCFAGPEMGNPGCDASVFGLADFDGDGDVDLLDFAVFQGLFPMTCP